MKTLTAVGSALDNLKGMERDQQIAQLRADRRRVVKVVELASLLGALPEALAAELPDRRALEVQLERAAEEVARLKRDLGRLPSNAREKLEALQTTVPDVMFSLAYYAEAEATLMVAELLHRYAVAQTDPTTAALLEDYELKQREERAAVGVALVDGISKAMKAVEAEPGGGWFAGSTRQKVEALAGEVRGELAALRRSGSRRARRQLSA
ncbi:hypothetical protein JKP75_13185 [Blastococcus sp. TML/M2B]|nr:hypothetical protein [Blastococcus sp. TML/M2B]MBN1093431.1 hypothetical protein [Blastococcus sp. TML/M2B]